ncbi:hypothetical protein GIB67_000514 [Kingdonia uniflora]|uniref:Uncharacterized protein n=1 Tax=Kingdonia uniflora TaxID=39325 RepID=A0A7J7NTV0_9MAGN|nr:hypothetical protein GIB67_000514 [Kingdonia uniflora]
MSTIQAILKLNYILQYKVYDIILEVWMSSAPHAKYFRNNIRQYNTANAFTSLGVRLDDCILNGRGPIPFSIHRELKHRVGALLPEQIHYPIYVQLYIYDSSSALNARADRNPQLDLAILQLIQDNLLEYNPFDRIYRQAYEVLKEASSANGQNVNVRAYLHYSSRTDRRRYSLPLFNEIAVVNEGQRFAYNVVVDSVKND